MFWLLLFLFTVLPVVELALLIQIGTHLGALPTVGLVLLTGAVGAALARHQGVAVVSRIRAELQGGRMPTDALADAALVLVAGVLLVTPGVLTDAFGFSLLIPPCRAVMRRLLARWAKARFQVVDLSGGPGVGGPGVGGPFVGAPFASGPETRDIEAEVRDVDAPRPPPARVLDVDSGG